MKYLYRFLLILCLIIIWLNVRLYSKSGKPDQVYDDIQKELAFVGSSLKSDKSGAEMQKIYPEGFFFINVLYGLAWCELAISDSTQNQVDVKTALDEAHYAYNQIDSDDGKEVFDEKLSPPYGVFYLGWKNYLLSKILMLEGGNSLENLSAFKRNCYLIEKAMLASKTPYLPSYEKHSWPSDMVVAIASLANHDKLFEPKYSDLIKGWVKNIELRFDGETGLIPHKVDHVTGNSIAGTRGCSISLILRFLAEIDTGFANKQYQLYSKQFRTTSFGLPATREYPKGKKGDSDADSGPVILGVGFSATIVSVGTLAYLESKSASLQQYLTIHAFGFSRTNEHQKAYLFEKLPMADAFIAWSRASALNAPTTTDADKSNWRWPFHLYSILIMTVFLSPYIYKVMAKGSSK